MRRGCAATTVALLLFATTDVHAAAYCTTPPSQPPAPDASAPPGATPGTDATRGLIGYVERRLGNVPASNLGPVAETLADELRKQLCQPVTTRGLLTNTCAADAGGNVAGLRARLIADLLRAPATSLAARLGSLTAEQRVAVAFLSALSGSLEPAEVSHRLAMALGYAVSEQCSPPAIRPNEPVALAVAVVWDLLHDSKAAAERGQSDAEATITATLTRLRGVPPGAGERPLIAALAKQSVNTTAWWKAHQQTPTDEQALTQLLYAELTLYQAALSLTHARPVTLPPEAWSTIGGLIQGNVEAALAEYQKWLVSRAQLRSEFVDAAQTMMRFARARTREEAERIVRSQLLGLGPWSEKVLFSASGGVPQLESGNFNVVGEGQLGYNDEKWGAVGQGGASVYDFEEPGRAETVAKFFGGADAWFSLNLGDATDFDFRGTFEGVLLDSDSTVTGSAGTFRGDESSLLLRGGGLLGLRHQGPDLAVGAWLGGGAQLNSFENTVIQGGSTSATDDDSVGGFGQLRARLQWGFVQRLLSLRLSADSKFYRLVRVASQVDQTGSLVDTDSEATQLEVVTRAFVDVEAARVFDFVPGAGIGVDLYRLDVSGQGTETSTVPIYMLGVRRTTF